jgi:hypothetical protein
MVSEFRARTVSASERDCLTDVKLLQDEVGWLRAGASAVGVLHHPVGGPAWLLRSVFGERCEDRKFRSASRRVR